MVPILNPSMPIFLFSPPTNLNHSPNSLQILSSLVLLSDLSLSVPQFHAISDCPLCNAKVKSMWYFLKIWSIITDDEAWQHLVYCSMGKSRLGSTFVGQISLREWSNPEGLAKGNSIILVDGVYKCFNEYRTLRGPIYQLPCIPATNSTFLTSLGLIEKELIPYGSNFGFMTQQQN